MKMMCFSQQPFRFYLLLFLFFWSHPYSAQNFEDLHLIEIENFHKVDIDVFRSGQPDKSDFKDLEKVGVEQVLNLRNHHSDEDEAEGTHITLSHVRMNAGSLSEEELLEALRIIRDRKGPILIHCWHGSDRTGAVIAMYRIIYQNWTKEEAVEELVNGGYGHHKWYYKNIPKLIRNINIDNFKQKLDAVK